MQMDGLPVELSSYSRSNSPSGYHLSSGESEHSRCRYSDLQDVCMAIESLTTLDLPMVVDSIVIYEMKGSYYTSTRSSYIFQGTRVNHLQIHTRGETQWGKPSNSEFTAVSNSVDARREPDLRQMQRQQSYANFYIHISDNSKQPANSIQRRRQRWRNIDLRELVRCRDVEAAGVYIAGINGPYAATWSPRRRSIVEQKK
ncbi:hypothetical protein F511_36198 [Dorcoceras hygrometricum]|uniref:Uncharacterized protein n=1 Tax=Dorcoceras hygrometricum TaxID=472368 RepID=A0A2Z7DAG5_9LAMI|nr:hypothetical protein F511_36198 [Dorcoceras hygrometricum]